LDEEIKRYNPFGRGGGGAPMKDAQGNTISTFALDTEFGLVLHYFVDIFVASVGYKCQKSNRVLSLCRIVQHLYLDVCSAHCLVFLRNSSHFCIGLFALYLLNNSHI